MAEGIVLAERTDCVPGQPLGRPPAPDRQRAAAEDCTAWEPYDGLAVHTGRTVLHGGRGGAEPARCPRRAATTRLCTDGWELIAGAWTPFSEAISTWRATGTAGVECPARALSVPLPDWTWSDDCFASAHRGLEFWNRPRFTEDFRARTADVLGGHRTACAWGKIRLPGDRERGHTRIDRPQYPVRMLLLLVRRRHVDYVRVTSMGCRRSA